MKIVESVFADLANRELSRHRRAKAVIELLMLIRFPDHNPMFEAAVAQCMTRFLAQEMPSSQLRHLDPGTLDLIFGETTVSEYAAMASWQPLSQIGYDPIEYDNTSYAEQDIKYISEILHFIFWYEPMKKSKDSRKYSSLNKAYTYYYIYGCKEIFYIRSKNSFQKIWSRFKDICCLIYVIDQFGAYDFIINPNSNAFNVLVQKLVDDHHETDKIVGMASNAYLRLQTRLKGTALKSVNIPAVKKWASLYALPEMTLPDEIAERVAADDFYIPFFSTKERIKIGLKRLKKQQ